MDQILRWLAGLAGEAPAEGETLRFEFLSLPRGGLGLASLALFLAAVAGVWFIYRRDAKRLDVKRRLLLATLRVLVLMAVASFLLEPSLVKVRKVVRPGEVLLLLDVSQSMGHKDSYLRSQPWADGWKAAGVADPSLAARLDLAKTLCGDQALVAALASKNRLRPWVFGPGARPAPEVGRPAAQPGAPGATRAELPPPPVLDLAQIDATEGSTNLTAALRQALEASRDSRVAAIVLITDGRRNAGGPPEEAGAYLKRRKVGELLVVGVGDPEETWTVGVRDLQVAERAFKGDPIKVSATVVSMGYGPQTLIAQLYEASADGKRIKELGRASVEVGGDRTSAEAVFPPIQLEKEGEHFLVVEVEPPQGELPEDRHRKQQRVEVLAEKLRVLMVAGAPTREFRILRNQLIRDTTIDVACWLQSADADFPQDGDTQLKELPKTAPEVDAFDVVVLLDPDPELLEGQLIALLTKGVLERGTGLWWVMGEKFSYKAVRPGSPLASLVDLLPVEIDIQQSDKLGSTGLYFKREFPWALTTEGRDHRVTSLETDPVVNASRWSRLPGFYWWMPVLRAKPAAQVLVRHSDRTVRALDDTCPLVALQFVGAGRVLYTGSDETYRWRSVAEKYYNDFWVKGLRWLYEGKLAGGSSRYRLGVSSEKVTLGQDVEIYLRALDERFEPLVAASVPVRISGPGGIGSELELKPAPSGEGRFVADFRPHLAGTWQVHVGPDSGPNAGRPVSFEVVPSELESKGAMGLAELSRLCEAAGGRLVAPADLRSQAEEIASHSTEETFLLPYALWDKWLALWAIVALLALEWILRKRFDLL